MINFNSIQPFKNKFVYGQLQDGRLVDFQIKVPCQFEALTRQIVAMANSFGGIIIFGVNPNTQTVVGIQGDSELYSSKIKDAIKKLSVGITYSLKQETPNNKEVIILEIKKAMSTAYFSRTQTSPARQYAYSYSKNENEISFLKEQMRYTKVYKYMTLEAFLLSLYCKNWRFFEPSKWNDKFEQRFYCAKYKLDAAANNTPQLFATCVTRAKNNEAAWKVYSHGQGLGMHCLQLELDIVALRKQLRNASNCQFEEIPIIYKSENFIMELHKKNGPHYKDYFKDFTLNSFLKLLTLKREAYTYEQELRLFLIPQNNTRKRNNSKKAQYKDIAIDWKEVINKVRIDKNCSDAELVSIQKACFSVGINPIIKNYTFIGCGSIPQNSKNIEFERFDIDDMPGTGNITIS